MEAPPTDTNAAQARPVFYAGRFAARMREAGLPEGSVLLDDWDVLPARLAAALEGATDLVVVDLLSFPFEALTGSLRDVPLTVVLPDRDAGFLSAVFGEPVLARLGFFDRVATHDPATWEALRRRYRWPGGALVRLESAEPEAAATQLAALPPLRGLPGPSPHAGPGKAAHRAQRAALGPQFAAARGGRAEDVPFSVLEAGSGAGRWAASFDPARTRFRGLEADEEAVALARENFPEAGFDGLGPDLAFPYEDETFDLVFCVGLMGRHPDAEKSALLREMWRVARPGGRLLFLEDFVTGEDAGDRPSPAYPVSVVAFVELLLEATDWQVVMEHVESLRYPREDLTRGGVIAVSRLGVPKRW